MNDSPILHTRRLRLRRPTMDDVPVITWLCNDLRVASVMAEMPHPYLTEHAIGWLTTIAKREADGFDRTFLLESRERPEVVGAIGLILDSDGVSASTGYWVGCFHWGRGYATEALREILRHAFQDLGLKTVRAWHARHNAASGRVMEKAGMVLRRTEAGTWRRGDHIDDMVHRDLCAADWQRAQLAPGEPKKLCGCDHP